jgi:hypothetical protein
MTSTEAVINSEEDLKRSGIEPFVQSTLDPAAHEELLVLCLKLASFLVKNHGKTEEILQILSPQLDQLFQSDSPAVLAALLETLVTLLESLDQCLSVSRSLLGSGLWPQLSALLTRTSATHHVVELALTCLVALLGLLHRCSQFTTSSSEGSRSINHPTFDKVQKNILVEYFDKTTGERRLFKQLRCLLRLTSNDKQKAVRTLLLHFILVTVEEEPKILGVNLPEQDVDVLHVVLNTWLMLKPETGFPELCSRILATGNPAAQMAVVDMCCRQLSQPSDDDAHRRICTDVLLSVIREQIFSRQQAAAVHSQLRRRFFTKTSLAVLLAPHPVLVDLMATLAQSDIVEQAAELLEFNDPMANRDLTAQLQFFGVLCRAARRPILSLTRSEVKSALLSLLAGYAGGSPELKTAVCDLIAVELPVLEDKGEECGQPAEYLPALGTCIVSSSQAWQLRDSAIQVGYLLNYLIYCF